MPYGSSSVGLLVDGVNLLASKVFDFTFPSPEVLLEETHGFGDSWAEHLPIGLRKADLSVNGLYDDAADAQNELMNGNQSVSRLLVAWLTGGTVGKKFTAVEGAFAATYARVATRAALHKANASYTVSGVVDEGIVLAPLAAVTVDGNSEGATSVDHGASTALGGAAHLQLTVMSGFTGYIGKVRHSADDITYADLATFTNVTGTGPAKQRLVVAGTVNRHLAAADDVTGSGSVTRFIGFARF